MNIQAWLLLSTIALVLIAGVYAFLTYGVVKANRRAAEASETSSSAALEAARASQEALTLQRTEVAAHSNTHPFEFEMNQAGGHDMAFGFSLRTRGDS